MERVKRIFEHDTFQLCMKKISAAEKNRIYCLHDMTHCLDVARIAYIMCLEQGLDYQKDVIYAMALLHDIGRSEEYSSGRSHHEAGEKLARQILLDTGFSPKEQELICDAICRHKVEDADRTSLAYLLYKADKCSRRCYECRAADSCYWSEEQKNNTIYI
ncbi:MAG: HD domain-containing protein [Wujia sp.]